MNLILLTGAGFSRNWGGWLASEVYEYLLGCDLSQRVRDILWEHRRNGFEHALDCIRNDATRGEHGDLVALTRAIEQMFSAMNAGFRGRQLDSNGTRTVTEFLSRCSAIFTLNQDLLLELTYEDSVGRDWTVPGVRDESPSAVVHGGPGAARRITSKVAAPPFRRPVEQPYFKLHGSSNFANQSEDGTLLIVGGNKANSISRYPLLSWYQECFREELSKPNTRLIVIGYSFRDDHINSVILESARGGELKMFIVDHLGVDVLNHDRAALKDENPLLDLMKIVRGASRRSVWEIMDQRSVEFSKMQSFLAP